MGCVAFGACCIYSSATLLQHVAYTPAPLNYDVGKEVDFLYQTVAI